MRIFQDGRSSTKPQQRVVHGRQRHRRIQRRLDPAIVTKQAKHDETDSDDAKDDVMQARDPLHPFGELTAAIDATSLTSWASAAP